MDESKPKVKIAPNSKASEMMVLGCMLTSVNALNVAADMLEDVDFYYTEHKIIFQSLKTPSRRNAARVSARMSRFLLLGFLIVGLFSCASLGAFSESGRPILHPVLEKHGFEVGYDGRLKQAAWVKELLTLDSLSGEVLRGGCYFKEDSELATCLRSTLKDYRGSGYDRGHLAPAADHKSSQEAMNDTFLLSNISPQIPSFNRGYWAKLEKYVRKLVVEDGWAEVITGPLFLPKKGEDGKMYVSYEVIGPNNVAVPTHYFKILETSFRIETYVIPNEAIEASIPLDSFRSTVERVERISGVVSRKENPHSSLDSF